LLAFVLSANGNIGAVEGEDVKWLFEHHSLSWEFQKSQMFETDSKLSQFDQPF